MREIRITPRKPGEAAPVNTSRITVLGAGAPRSGKTRFAATFPRPLILADETEGGYTTVETMDSALWYEPNIPPRVWAIGNVTEFNQAIPEANNLIAKKEIQSIVVDSITFLADLMLAHLFSVLGTGDNRKVYGQLGVQLRDLRVKVHALKANVFWACLIQPPDEDHPLPRPSIPGKQGMAFGAGCDYILEFQRSVDKGVTRHSILTQSAIAGGRDSGALPPILPVPTYRGLVTLLQDRKAVEVVNDPEAIKAAAATVKAPPPTNAAGKRVFGAAVKK
jgi:hypothetical protein